FTRASSGTYFDSNGVMQLASANTPRFDHNPNTKESLGLLIEEQRTNSIRNNTMQGAVAGTPGTLPTNWTGGSIVNGLAREIVSFGEQSGIAYVDVRYSGTTTVAGSVVVQPEGGTSVAAVTGQTWVASSFLAIVGGSLNGISAVAQQVTGRSASGGFLENRDTNTTLTGNIVRYSALRTMTNALTARVTNDIVIIHPNSAAIDITLRIGMPQLEQGAFATSVIPTSGAAATRSADVATMTGTNFSSWYRQDEGTVYEEFARTSYENFGVYGRAFSINDGTAQNCIDYLGFGGTKAMYPVMNVGYANQINFSATTPSGPLKIAIGIARNNYLLATDGSQAISDTSCAIPVVNKIDIGHYAGSDQLNGTIKRLAYYPRRLANSELQLLTT
ncbi:MAG: hypothetical protein ACKPEZ_07040, partial [Planktothrix sp.]